MNITPYRWAENPFYSECRMESVGVFHFKSFHYIDWRSRASVVNISGSCPTVTIATLVELPIPAWHINSGTGRFATPNSKETVGVWVQTEVEGFSVLAVDSSDWQRGQKVAGVAVRSTNLWCLWQKPSWNGHVRPDLTSQSLPFRAGAVTPAESFDPGNECR